MFPIGIPPQVRRWPGKTEPLTYCDVSMRPPAARFPTVLLALLGAALLPLRTLPARADCAGDCNGDGQVRVDELVRGVRIALELEALAACAGFDSDRDGSISVAELVAAVGVALGGCAASPTVPVPTSTPRPTETPTINRPPVPPTAMVYRSFPELPIALSIGAEDPDGGPVACTADAMPEGAALDGPTGLFTWTPAEDQLGPFYVPYTCTDVGEPAASVDGELTFKISPPDPCAVLDCDPAAGCSTSLPEVTESCCAAGPASRVAEPVAGCPEGRVMFVGQNSIGFGRMQNCDVLYVRNFAQTGAEVRFHVEARCLDTLNRVTLRARMETAERLVFDEAQRVFLDPRPDGFAVRTFLRFSVNGPGPFFDMQDAEANFTLSLTDGNGDSASESLRVKLTFTPVPDRPEADPSPLPTSTPAFLN